MAEGFPPSRSAVRPTMQQHMSGAATALTALPSNFSFKLNGFNNILKFKLRRSCRYLVNADKNLYETVILSSSRKNTECQRKYEQHTANNGWR